MYVYSLERAYVDTGLYSTLSSAQGAATSTFARFYANSEGDRAFNTEVVWTREPDPALPEVLHDRIPKADHVWVGRYTDFELDYFVIRRIEVRQ